MKRATLVSVGLGVLWATPACGASSDTEDGTGREVEVTSTGTSSGAAATATSSTASASTGVMHGGTTGGTTGHASGTTSGEVSGPADAGCGWPGPACSAAISDPWTCGTCPTVPKDCPNGWLEDNAPAPGIDTDCCLPGLIPIVNPGTGPEPLDGTEYICAPPPGGVCVFQDDCSDWTQCVAPAQLQAKGICQ